MQDSDKFKPFLWAYAPQDALHAEFSIARQPDLQDGFFSPAWCGGFCAGAQPRYISPVFLTDFAYSIGYILTKL